MMMCVMSSIDNMRKNSICLEENPRGGENKVYIRETYLQCRIKYLRVDEK